MDSRIQVVHDQSGTPVAICGISSDITASKLAQRALEESELRFRSMARNIPGVVFQFTALPDGTRSIEYASDQITELLGISISDGLDNVLADFINSSHPEDRERLVRSIDASVETEKPGNLEGRFKGTSGQVLWLRGAANLRSQEEKLIFEGILLDITERNRRSSPFSRARSSSARWSNRQWRCCSCMMWKETWSMSIRKRFPQQVIPGRNSSPCRYLHWIRMPVNVMMPPQSGKP